MKIQCDVCDKDEASVFCCADEAALCSACDHRVHHANKLAGKHHRFSLHQPPPKQVPLCDICQERRAFFFCRQDRAILCRECDIPIHSANEHTQKHTRFLLTALQISATCSIYSASTSSAESPSSNSAKSDEMKSQKESTTNRSVSRVLSTPSTAKGTTARSTPETCYKINSAQLTSSSISDYSMETLPGWHVEDFLDPANPPSPYCFYKNGESEKLQFWDADLESNMSDFPTESMGLWVPQIQNQLFRSVDSISFGSTDGNKEQFDSNNNIKYGRKWSEDNTYTVPQITPPSSAACFKEI